MGSSSTFEELYSEHLRFVCRSLRRLGVRPEEIPDAAHDLFIIVHSKLSTFDGANARGWLFAICLRVAADWRKRATVRRERITSNVPEQSVLPNQMGVVERAQARAALERALDTLDEKQRAVFVLYELERWSMPEIATSLGCPVQTAYARLHAARKRVLEKLGQELKPGDWI